MIKIILNEIRFLDGKYQFIGDGKGDFENIDDDCTIEVLKDYIKRVKNQFSIAELILYEKENK